MPISVREDRELDEKVINKPARYAINYEVNMDPILRNHWIAGASIQIIDRERKEVIAEKTWFIFEKGLGGKGGGRIPWLFAIACDDPVSPRLLITQAFLISVEIPSVVYSISRTIP